MTYIAYSNSYGEEKALVCGNARNKKEMQEKILHNKFLQVFSRVQYGKKSYSIGDIYAGR